MVNAGGLINVHDELHGYSKMQAMHRVDSIFGATKSSSHRGNSRSTRTRRRSCSPRTGSGRSATSAASAAERTSLTSHRTYGMDFDRNLHHGELGLSDEQVVEMYRLMLTTRRIDDRLFALQRQGRAPFVVGSSGHEAVQVASALALDREKDWVLPYYRDMGVALAWGFEPVEIFLGAFAKKPTRCPGPSTARPLVQSPATS